MYALPELATAVQYGINVVAVVFVDGALGASNNDQRTRFQGRVVGTELRNPSFAEVARGVWRQRRADGARAARHRLAGSPGGAGPDGD